MTTISAIFIGIDLYCIVILCMVRTDSGGSGTPSNLRSYRDAAAT
jgi:hypothetical protein